MMMMICCFHSDGDDNVHNKTDNDDYDIVVMVDRVMMVMALMVMI